MADKVIVWFRDFDRDVQQVSVDTVPAADDTARQNLIDAMQIWSIGANDGAAKQEEMEARVGAAATSPVAQLATQLIIEMKDSVTGIIYRERVPCPDLTMADDATPDPAWIVTGQGSNSLTIANPDHDNYATLKSAFDAAWQSPTGNAGTLQRAYVEE